MNENPVNLQCAVSIFGNHWHALELDSFWQCVQKHHILYILTLDNLDLSVQRFHGCLDKNNRNLNLGLDTFVDPPFWLDLDVILDEILPNTTQFDEFYQVYFFFFQVWSVVYNFMAASFRKEIYKIHGTLQ